MGASQLGTSITHTTSGNWSAVIGSLPKGLTSDEKMKIKMSVPPSPSAALLKEMNQVRGLMHPCSHSKVA